MLKTLDHLKAHRRGHRGIVTKYVQETKSLLESDNLNEKCRLRIRTLSELLQEKCTVLKSLDEEVLATCPTDEIEQEIVEAKDVHLRIVEMRAEIDGQSRVESEEKRTGKPRGESVMHVVSNKNKLSCDKSEACNKMGAPPWFH